MGRRPTDRDAKKPENEPKYEDRKNIRDRLFFERTALPHREKDVRPFRSKAVIRESVLRKVS
jgi:hypothetical protein